MRDLADRNGDIKNCVRGLADRNGDIIIVLRRILEEPLRGWMRFIYYTCPRRCWPEGSPMGSRGLPSMSMLESCDKLSYVYAIQLQILPMQYTVPFWACVGLGGAEPVIVTVALYLSKY